MCRRTNGQAVGLASLPALPTSVYNLISDELSTITILDLMPEPGWDDWLTAVAPPFYFNVRLTTPVSKNFNIEVCMPSGTPPGTYNFKIYVSGDGAVYSEIDVSVTHCIPLPVGQNRGLLFGLFSLILLFQGNFSRSLKS